MPTSYVFAALTVLTVAQVSNAFEPLISKSELRSGSTLFKRGDVHSPWRRAKRVGHHKILVDGGSVTLQHADKQASTVRSPDKLPLRWVASDDDVAYFVNEVSEVDASRGDFFVAPRILRFSVKGLRWLEPLLVGNQEPGSEPEAVTLLGGVFPSPSGLVVLTYAIRAEVGADDFFGQAKRYNTKHYDVDFFPPRSTQAKWSKRFAWDGDSPSIPGPAFVDRNTMDREGNQVRTLNLIHRGLVLICAGKNQDVLCLKTEDGSEDWRVRRIWEFQRGFVGPSVYQHFITRFGIDESEQNDAAEAEQGSDAGQARRTEKAKVRMDSSKELFYKLRNPSIVAGPVVVPCGDGWRGSRIFVAVADEPDGKGELGHLATTLAESVVYEIDDRGDLQAMAKLPRFVVGEPSAVSSGALVWTCERGCLVRLGLSVSDFTRGFAMSGDDMLCRVEWYREIPGRIPKAWFAADPEHGIACSSKKHMFRTGGSYVKTADEQVYHFLITVVELETGLDKTLTLDVPFLGDLTMPEADKSSGSGWTHSHDPHLLRIAELQIQDGRLRIILQTDESTNAVEFDVGSLDAGREVAVPAEPRE